MCYDDVAQEQSDNISDNCLSQFLDINIKRPITSFILKHNSGDNPEFTILQKESFNITLQIKYTYSATNIRFPQPRAVLFPKKKIQNKVAIIRYISDQTSVLIPFVLHSSTQKKSPLNLGPFIIISHIAHSTTIYNALNIPGCLNKNRDILDLNIDEDQLKKLYRQLAIVLLKLSMPEFPQIRSLGQVDNFTQKVTSRPLSININELLQLRTLP